VSIISAGGAVVGSQEGGYEIERSLRFNSADSAYLNRTFASAGDRRTFTLSFWFKRSAMSSGANYALYTYYVNDSNRLGVQISSDNLNIYNITSGSANLNLTTSAVFRDPAAWYHIVIRIDTTQPTPVISLYINNVLQTTTGTNTVAQNNYLPSNSAGTCAIGRTEFSTPQSYFNGYMTEINFIDGSALTPSSFGEFNSDTGVWQPIKYIGTYGTNGFYLNFSDNASTTTLGDDFSGNNNDWTTNNFSVTAGAGNDSLVDSPTRYGTDTGVGGEVRGNYCTLNPNDRGTSQATLNNGNLDATCATGTNYFWAKSTLAIPKTNGWYMEITLPTVGSFPVMGLVPVSKTTNMTTATYVGEQANEISWFGGLNGIYQGASNILATSALSANDVIMIAHKEGKTWFGRNGTWVNSGDPAAGTGNLGSTLTDEMCFAISLRGTTAPVINANFGQRPFAYTAPSGFKALVTTNLPTPTIADGSQYFDVALYTTNGSAQTITTNGNGNALQFTPDFLWNKGRNLVQSHYLANIVTGLGNTLSTDTTAAEAATGLFTAVSQGSFSMASEPAGRTKVTWLWKAGGTPAVSNTAGTITSTVSVNTTSGFSIVTYTGNGSTGTVGHGLGVAPSMIIVKVRSTTNDWGVGHASVGWSQAGLLNLTNSFGASSYFNSTAPTSTVFSVGASAVTNTNSATYVAYCFAPVAGYSAFGSYTGNGSADGPFVFTGFRPRYIMQKRTDSTGTWELYDTARDTYNVMSADLAANLSDAETTVARFDSLSNGFKIRTTGAATNASGGTYIYMAFAENPFSIALAR
jgi:hypothetical protein